MNGTVFIYVPGIRTRPGDERNWHCRAVTWTNTRTPHKAEDVEYFTLAITRPFGDHSRAHKLSRKLEFYEGWRIVLVGHSNGTDVILDGLKEDGWPSIHALFLISGACNPDFEDNGINSAVRRDRIGSVHVWIANNDLALKLAATPIGRILGYGTMGKTGPKNMDIRISSRVFIERADTGHSGWFSGENFEATMSKIAASVVS